MRRGDIAVIAIALIIIGLIQSPHQTRVVGAVVVGAAVCGRIPGLAKSQREQCRKMPHAMPAVGEGAELGLRECRHQFRHHRWNCSHVAHDRVFGHVVVVGSREAAFTYAISSAGVTYAVTAACSRGNITACGCEPAVRTRKALPPNGWEWGGCSADVTYGMRFARRFLDAREVEGDARSLMNLHNNKAGRKLHNYALNETGPMWISLFVLEIRETKIDDEHTDILLKLITLDSRDLESWRYVKIWKIGPITITSYWQMNTEKIKQLGNFSQKIVKAMLQTECKCHGVSGSCTVRTCWRTLPSFRQIGDALMKKYYRARPVIAITPPSSPAIIQSTDYMDQSSIEVVPIVGNDAKTQGKPNEVNVRTDRRSLKKFSSSRKLHLVLKRAKLSGGVGINQKRIPKRSELVFLQPSPNYCEPDLTMGSLGTQGRSCNRTSKGTDGCDLMCCGRGYNTHQYTRTWQCRCKFHWCCRVHCDTCTERTEEYTCK